GKALYFANVFNNSFDIFRFAAGVKINPGATALQRILSFPYCVATYFVKLTTAALDAPYATRIASLANAAMEAVLIMEPPPASIMCGIAYLHPCRTLFKLTFNKRSHSSKSI